MVRHNLRDGFIEVLLQIRAILVVSLAGHLELGLLLLKRMPMILLVMVMVLLGLTELLEGLLNLCLEELDVWLLYPAIHILN